MIKLFASHALTKGSDELLTNDQNVQGGQEGRVLEK
jgi:hypothetical protein